ncbi:MAG: hypothetical protein ACI9R3_002904 [Verrucomicrobiales bacterium]
MAIVAVAAKENHPKDNFQKILVEPEKARHLLVQVPELALFSFRNQHRFAGKEAGGNAQEAGNRSGEIIGSGREPYPNWHFVDAD